MQALRNFAENSTSQPTRTIPFPLPLEVTTPTYIVTLIVITTYSMILKSVCNKLQEVNMKSKVVHEHIHKLLNLSETHRKELVRNSQ